MEKKTLCGYSWTDVYTALSRAIANGDMNRAQRWGAELLCSETGVSRLEAVLLAVWSEHVGTALGSWPGVWHTNISYMRNEWMRARGDSRLFRNSPAMRVKIAECIGYLVVAAKKPRPVIPKSADVFKEAESVKRKLHGGEASPDQISTQRVWYSREDAPTLRTLGNELEASIRTAQTSRALFWLVWILTLDSQKNRPATRDRAPTHIQGKARKSLAWFLLALFQDMARNGLDARNTLAQTMDCMVVVWMRLGARFRREVFATILVSLCDRVKLGPLGVETRQAIDWIDNRPIRASLENIDGAYEEIARDMQLTPTNSTTETPGTPAVKLKKVSKADKDRAAQDSSSKLTTTDALMRKMYGMDVDEDE